MHVVLLVLLGSSTCLGEFVITAHDRMIEEFNTNIAARGLFGFDLQAFLKKNGYPFESHEVTTEDGYVLAIHRIPYGRNADSTFADEKKPVVLLMHGLGSSSADFIIPGVDRSLPMLLADQGYDVWLGNNRGNTWSRKHLELDPDKNETFWDFSFHELGVYDLPVIIDHVLAATESEKISYIGHSQGATQFFVMGSEKQEYNDKINSMVALGPAVYCENMTNPIFQILKNYYTLVEFGSDYLNLTEFLGHSFVIETALKLVCKDGSDYQEVCPFVLFLLFGFDSEQFDRSLLETFLEVFPAGMSMRELKHYLQLIKSGHFRQFDHGVLNNLKIYNQASPPDYKLSQVTAPVTIYYAMNDWLVDETNVDQLADELGNLVEKNLIEYEYFNHLDYVLANDVVYFLYFDLINKLNVVNGLDPFTTSSTISTSTTTTTSTVSTVPSDQPTDPDIDPTGTGSTVSTNPNRDSTTPGTGSAFSLNSFAQTTCIFMFLIKLLL